MSELGSRYFRLLPPGLVERLVPKHGTDPSVATRGCDFHWIEKYTATISGALYVVRIAQDGDPGYRATSVRLGECGIALTFDCDKFSGLRGMPTARDRDGSRWVMFYCCDSLPAGVSLQAERLN
ncbi:hypothetical protein [Mycobacterium lepromatosis]|uniref:hypothetical protein n=1 Tax=Mycobacterium lepromatosis TaxID=480418 RepID=UPI000678909A|nr:hypothetical protein [Mycobacterium lepromatosis]